MKQDKITPPETKSSNGLEAARTFTIALLLCLLLPLCTAFGAEPDHTKGIETTSFVYPKANDEIRAYNFQHYLLAFLRPFLTAAAILVLLQTGALSKIRDSLSGLKNYYLFATLFFALILSILFLVDLPASFYQHYLLEHQFGLSKQNLGAYSLEAIQKFSLSLIFAPFLALIALILKRFKRHCALIIWSLICFSTAVLVFAKPLLIDTIFNQFHPLEESALKHKIVQLCKKAQLQNPTILVADRSKQTKKINAYVTGLSSSTRIVLYDTLVQATPEDELLAVLAHEIGHYKYQHVLFGIVLSLLLLLPILKFAEKLLVYIPFLPKAWQIKSKSDPIFLVFCLAIINVAEPLISPIECSIAREIETQADDYALRLTENPLAMAKMFARLSEIDKADPEPAAIIEFWLYTHPSIRNRIDRVLEQGNLK